MTRPNIILEALEPGGEPWLELTYEEGLKEIDAFWPSPQLKPESTTTVTALEGHVQITTPGDEADIIDGLMDDIDEIELLDSSGAAIGSRDDIFIGGDSGAVGLGHGNDTVMKDAFHVRSTAASPATSTSTPDDNAPIASRTGSPELPNFDQVTLTPTRSDGHLANRGSTGIPSSDLRSSMQKEMHHEDEAAISVARAPTLPNVPTLTGLGHVSTRSEGDAFKSLEAPDLRTQMERSRARRADGPDDEPQDRLADYPSLHSSPTLHKHGRKHARAASILLETEDIHSSSKQSSPTRPLAKKPRRRGRTASQSELQVDNEVMQEGCDTDEAERSEDTGKSKPQSTTVIDTEEVDSSLDDLTLNLDQTPPAEPVTEEALSSELPSGQSWNFDALGNPSLPESDHDDEVEVNGDSDNAASHTEEPAIGHQSRDSAKHIEPQDSSVTLARKDSLLEFDPDGHPSSAPAESNPATAAAPSLPQEAAQSHINSPTPRTTQNRPSSRPPPTRKPPNREIAALMGPRVGAKGAGVSKSSGPRQTRGQKKAEKSESPNASKAAKKRHTAAVDYSKML